jgi:uncharacterized membrane protein (DUF2068 family)
VQRERGLVVIIAYKLSKGGLWLVLAVILLVLMRMGLGDDVLAWSDRLRHHSRAWSVELANLLVRAASRRGLWTLVVALVGDGILTLVEGWALWRGHWWGPWLVVVATGSLLPFEVVSIARSPDVSRALVLAVNALIVWYLARKALRDHRARKASQGAGAERLEKR